MIKSENDRGKDVNVIIRLDRVIPDVGANGIRPPGFPDQVRE
jgi:hypothetical protein